MRLPRQLLSRQLLPRQLALALDSFRSLERMRWQLHRAVVRKTGAPVPMHRGGDTRVLLLSHDHPITESQFFPFFYYRRQLAQRYGIQLREQDISLFQLRDSAGSNEADIVLLQPWFDIGVEGLSRLLDQITRCCRPHRIVFIDSYAPSDLRYAEVLADRVDLYVKKQVLRDRTRYGKATRGDTNLTDYYCRLYKYEKDEVTFNVPTALLDKLMVGPTFFTADYMLEDFKASGPRRSPALYDVHARLGRSGTDWYQAMREDALRQLEAIGGLRTVPSFGVARKEFLRELAASKLCLSPFGYGEVAWRDYEAVLNGSLLVKPDMTHLETSPNIFLNGETYATIAWDFSNMGEVIQRYLRDEEERLRLANNAYHIINDYLVNERFVPHMAPLFESNARQADPP